MNSIKYEEHTHGKRKSFEENEDIFIKEYYSDINLIEEYYDSVYHYHTYKDQKLTRQGWKIHLSCTLGNYQKVLDLVAEYMMENHISFKYIYSKKILSRYLSGDVHHTQLGKFITIYPTNTEHFISIVNYLYTIFKGYKGPYILSDRKYRDSNIYYRYGVIESNSEYLITPSGDLIDDNREFFSIPYFEKDPFEEIKESYVFLTKNIIGKKVFPTSIVYQSASGNVYDALYNGSEVILKEAREGVLAVNGSAISDLQNEELILNKLKDVKGVPNVIFSFYEGGNYYLVEEKIPGTTITFAKSDIDVRKKYSIHNMFLSAIELIDVIHRSKIIINDISSNNFIINSESDTLLWICDFGSSYIYEGRETNRKLKGITPTFYDSRLASRPDFDSDYHKLGYVFMDYIFPFNRLNRYESTGTLSLEKLKQYCDLEGVSSDVYNIIELLITQPNEWKKKVNMLLEKEIIYLPEKKKKKFLFSDNEQVNKKLNDIYNKLLSGTSFALENLSTDYYIISNETDPHNIAKGLIIPSLLTKNANAYSLPATIKFGGILNSNLGFLYDACLKNNFFDNFSLYKEKLITWINSSKDYSLSNGYVGLGIIFLLADYNNEHNDLDYIFQLIHEKIKNTEIRYEKDLNIGLFEGVLGIALFEILLFQRTNNTESYKNYLKIISNITQTVKEIDGELYYTENIGSQTSTPYLSNGMAGFILVNFYAYQSKNLSFDEKQFIWNNYISPFLFSIRKIRWAQNRGLLHGSLGISFIIFEIAKQSKDKSLLKDAFETLLVSTSFNVEIDKRLFTFDQDGQYLSFDIESGSGGFLLILELFLEFLRGEENEDI